MRTVILTLALTIASVVATAQTIYSPLDRTNLESGQEYERDVWIDMHGDGWVTYLTVNNKAGQAAIKQIAEDLGFDLSDEHRTMKDGKRVYKYYKPAYAESAFIYTYHLPNEDVIGICVYF